MTASICETSGLPARDQIKLPAMSELPTEFRVTASAVQATAALPQDLRIIDRDRQWIVEKLAGCRWRPIGYCITRQGIERTVARVTSALAAQTIAATFPPFYGGKS